MNTVDNVVCYVTFPHPTVFVYFKSIFLQFESHLENWPKNGEVELNVGRSTSSGVYFKDQSGESNKELAMDDITLDFDSLKQSFLQLLDDLTEFAHILSTRLVQHHLHDLPIAL